MRKPQRKQVELTAAELAAAVAFAKQHKMTSSETITRGLRAARVAAGRA